FERRRLGWGTRLGGTQIGDEDVRGRAGRLIFEDDAHLLAGGGGDLCELFGELKRAVVLDPGVEDLGVDGEVEAGLRGGGGRRLVVLLLPRGAAEERWRERQSDAGGCDEGGERARTSRTWASRLVAFAGEAPPRSRSR